MATKPLPPRDLVRQLLDYDPATGDFTWLPRPREMFKSSHNCGTWHTRYCGKVAGCTCQDGYLVMSLVGGHYLLHRLAWLYVHGEPVPSIDHIDGNRANNRITNLREATPGQNQANKGLSTYNLLGIKGVRRYKGSFRACIRFNGTGIHLGTFKTAEDAAEAYRNAAVKLRGEFARWE